jgi:hypothetical protein
MRRRDLVKALIASTSGALLVRRSPAAQTAASPGDPRTQAEATAGATPVGTSFAPGDVRRYGIIANSQDAATANTNALVALLNPGGTGPTGRIVFANTTGADTYYFNGMVPVRDKVQLDLDGCTLDFSKPYVPATDDGMGFLTFIRDVTVENGAINVNYEGGGASNAGPVMRIGSRLGYKFSTFARGIAEDQLTTAMGNIVLRNLRLTTNNPHTVSVLMLGGLRNVRVENVTIDGSGAAPHGIYYEFGDHHYEATVANRTTSHASDLYFGNVSVSNLDTGGADGGGLALIGAACAVVENLTVDTALNGFQFRPGEALFYKPGTSAAQLANRCMTLRNIHCTGITGTGLALIGAESKAHGYLAREPLTESQQTDLMRFSVDGGSISAAGSGLTVSGPCDIRNVTLNGTATSGQVIISDDCIQGVFTNCEILNSSGIGVRANFGDHRSSTPRLKTLAFDNCRVAGNTGAGYSFGHTKLVEIHSGRIGYQMAIDGVDETTQTPGVSVDETSLGGGVYCYGVDVNVSSGIAYSIIGTITNPCGLFDPKGTVTFRGNWDRDGVAYANSTDIASKDSYPNTAGKYEGRNCYDTSNKRMMVATGPANTDAWQMAGGSVTVTPK